MNHGLKLTASLCVAATLLVGGASATTLRTCHIGCSTTDVVTWSADPTAIAQSLGNTHQWTKITNPGCGVECVWFYRKDEIRSTLSGSSWDGVAIACYPNGNPLTIANDLKFMDSMYVEALRGNPNSILYVSSVWPFNSDGLTFDQSWNSTTTQYHAGYSSKKFHEDLIRAAQTKYGAEKARLLPFGHAMAKLNDWIKTGRTTVLSSPFQLYKDYIHLTDEGSYLLCMVQYATLFKSDPHGATRTFQAGDHQATVSQPFAELAWAIAWETVNELSAWTGVGNTGVVPPARVSAAGPAQHAAGSAELFTIAGRAGRAATVRTGLYVMTRHGTRLVTGAER